MTESFTPPRWAAGPHSQTLLARILRSSRGLSFERERIETPDGDFFDVDWGPTPRGGSAVAIVIHGLEGSSRRSYVRNACRELFRQDVRPVALNFRGCSGEPNRTLPYYHSGDTRDLRQLIQLIRDRNPDARVGALGFSLGGNVLLKLLGESTDGGAALLDAAVAMSVPYDLAAGCALLERSWMGRQYSNYFLRSLRRKVGFKRDRLPGVLDMERVDAAETIWAFDDWVTAPLNGFEDAADYYARCSSNQFLPSIRVPTLLLHAEDDPFLPPSAIPHGAARSNPHLELRLTTGGGHVGFVHGAPWAPRFWADENGGAFLGQTLAGAREA